jgi:flagellar protein FlbD
MKRVDAADGGAPKTARSAPPGVMDMYDNAFPHSGFADFNHNCKCKFGWCIVLPWRRRQNAAGRTDRDGRFGRWVPPPAMPANPPPSVKKQSRWPKTADKEHRNPPAPPGKDRFEGGRRERTGMIRLTRRNGNAFILNAELIKFVEEVPDTIVTLRDGEKVLVKESADTVVERALEYCRSTRFLPEPV